MKSVIKFANEAFQRKIAPLKTEMCGGDFRILREGVIEGHWHEDGNTYQITCPPQLQDCLLELLKNCGHLRFVEGEL